MRFKLFSTRDSDGQHAVFFYDNMTSGLFYESGAPIPFEPPEGFQSQSESQAGDLKPGYHILAAGFPPAVPVSKDHPGKKTGNITKLKIQLGLGCNYRCAYCAQRNGGLSPNNTPRDVEVFMENLDSWLTSVPEQIQFWGGEPLVYYKTFKPLAEALHKKFPCAAMMVITNGSLLTPEINDWLNKMGFFVGVSHDGPGQFQRGPDPFENPTQRAAIFDLYKKLHPQGRISFNVVLTAQNHDREAIQDFFIKLTDDVTVRVGEGAFIDPHDEAGVQLSQMTPDEHWAWRQRTYDELKSMRTMTYPLIHQRVKEWAHAFAFKRPAASLWQRCAMDDPQHIAVDLKGNVLSCQNHSATGTAPNGQRHKIGHVSDLSKVTLDTGRHWSFRPECPNCPVLQGCKGACMVLEGKEFETACQTAYSDHIPFFAFVIEQITGFRPCRIERMSETPLPEDRAEVWGKERN